MAAFIARNHPELVKSVVLPSRRCRICCRDRTVRSTSRSAPRSSSRARLAIRDGFAELALRGLMDWAFGWPWLPSSCRRSSATTFTTTRTRSCSRRRRARRTRRSAATTRRASEVPVLIIDGDKSAEARKDMCEALARCQPKAEHVTLKGASYGMNWQAAGGFNKAVLKFLEEHSAPPAPPVAADSEFRQPFPTGIARRLMRSAGDCHFVGARELHPREGRWRLRRWRAEASVSVSPESRSAQESP